MKNFSTSSTYLVSGMFSPSAAAAAVAAAAAAAAAAGGRVCGAGAQVLTAHLHQQDRRVQQLLVGLQPVLPGPAMWVKGVYTFFFS